MSFCTANVFENEYETSYAQTSQKVQLLGPIFETEWSRASNCVSVPNLVEIGQNAAEIWRFFPRWRPSAILDLLRVCSDHPRRALVVFIAVLNLVGIDAIVLRRYSPTKLCDGAQMAIFGDFLASCICSEPRAAVFRPAF